MRVVAAAMACALACAPLALAGARIPADRSKWFGSHLPAEGVVEETTGMPSAPAFYSDYVVHHKPVIFRGAAEHWPAKKLWSDDWLREKMGDYKVRMETKDDDKTVSLDPLGFTEFLDRYRSDNLYLVDEVPPPLMEYAYLPECLLCHNITSKFFVTFLWISSGNTVSKMHIDTDENMLCVLEGTKRVALVHPKYSRDLYADRADLLGVSPIHPAKVDLDKYPRVGGVPWIEGHVNAGDCLYLPQNWWHFVESTPAPGPKGRNVAIAMWWKSRPLAHAAPFRQLRSKSHPFADLVDAYEEYVVDVAPVTPTLQNCSSGLHTMAEFEFASDRQEDGEYTEDDKADRDEGDWVNPLALELGIEDEYGHCHYNLSHPRNPCFASNCMDDDDTPYCIKYALDYCRHTPDNGCMDLIWLLNKKQKDEFRSLLLFPDLFATPDEHVPPVLKSVTFEGLPALARTLIEHRKRAAAQKVAKKAARRAKKQAVGDDEL